MALKILDDPFASAANVSLSESFLKEAAPSMPDTKVQDLIRASERESFDKQEGINEKFLLDKEFASIASNISAELGPFSLNVYERAQDLVAAGVLRELNEGDRTGSFRGQNASGGSQWDVQQINVASLNDTSGLTSVSDAAEFRSYTTGTTGEFNIAPSINNTAGTDSRDPANDSTNNVGSNGDGTHSPDDDQQALFLFGMYSSTNPRVVEQAQVDINDGESRTPYDVYSHSNLGTLQAFDMPSIEYITDDDDFDINGSATSNSTADVYPFGIDLNSSDNLADLFSTRT